MTVQYHSYHAHPVPTYWCGWRTMHRGEHGHCQTIHGGSLDAAISDEVALHVQQDLVARSDEAGRLQYQHVERARYEADLAACRFRKIDPDHRFVADAFEADWNAKLRVLSIAQETYAQAATADDHIVTDAERAALLALAIDFPRLWCDPTMSMKAKTRMIRLLIADVTLTKGDVLHANIRFAGGATCSLDIPLPKACVELRTTDAEIIREIDQLIDTYTDAEIADVFNERGIRTVVPTPWTGPRMSRLRHTYGLTDRRTRLLTQGLLTPSTVVSRYSVSLGTVHLWRRRGLLRSYPVNDKGDYLYEIPPDDLPAK